MACYSSQDHDVAGVFFAEERKCGFDEVELAEEDYFELVANEVLGCGTGGEFFDCADDSYSNVLAIEMVLRERNATF